ncbi:MAG: type II toxin-antitoxin system mRNA interferase toxin, RelE/StbE family [Sulfurimonas sp.]|nr:MAG: type II toxin-antitoxin system mRNA interferase toxin, RelE/StbE family [Sulfurimonas sp.]
MFDIAIHKLFLKDIKKSKLNATNTAKLFMYISLLLNENELPSESLEHALKGEYKDTREFHISGDLLVIYRLKGKTLELLRIGTHSQLFM